MDFRRGSINFNRTKGGLCSQVSHGPHPTLAPTGSEIPTKRGRSKATQPVDLGPRLWILKEMSGDQGAIQPTQRCFNVTVAAQVRARSNGPRRQQLQKKRCRQHQPSCQPLHVHESRSKTRQDDPQHPCLQRGLQTRNNNNNNNNPKSKMTTTKHNWFNQPSPTYPKSAIKAPACLVDMSCMLLMWKV